VLLAYVDESYTKDRYYIAALVVPESQISPLTQALDAVTIKAVIDHGLNLTTELHGHDLVAGKSDWEPLAPQVRVRIGVYSSALAAIGSHDVAIILRGVDSGRLRQRYFIPYHPHAIVLGHLMERIDERAEAAGEQH
jgi:hypothetical protein